MKKWEYLKVYYEMRTRQMGGVLLPMDDALAELGNDGWELVSAPAWTIGSGPVCSATLIFKREKTDDAPQDSRVWANKMVH